MSSCRCWLVAYFRNFFHRLLGLFRAHEKLELYFELELLEIGYF